MLDSACTARQNYIDVSGRVSVKILAMFELKTYYFVWRQELPSLVGPRQLHYRQSYILIGYEGLSKHLVTFPSVR